MDTLVVRQLGHIDYQRCWQAQKDFTDRRDDTSSDQIWLLQHQPVFTQGQAGKAEHILAPGDIPVIQVDRGGQVTYHGPGQLVVYLLIDIRRRGFGVRHLVSGIENAIMAVVADYGIAAKAKPDAPGVYLPDGAKLASLGLRVRRGCSFHGLALNIELDLEPFNRINPCGFAGQQVVRMKDLVEHWHDDEFQRIEQKLVRGLMAELGYNEARFLQGLPDMPGGNSQ